MEIEKSLNFYLSTKELIMALKAGEEAGRYSTVVIYLCCNITKINLDDFIKILTDYKTSHPEDAFMYDKLIFNINKIVYKIYKTEINNIINMIKELI